CLDRISQILALSHTFHKLTIEPNTSPNHLFSIE
ncbi:MAG: hypothetical protein ACI85I_002118, partial [Arenicella sp.]